MGYLVAAHATRTAPDVARPEMLPPGLAWAVTGTKMRHPGTSIRSGWTGGENGLLRPDPNQELSADLPDNLGALTRVHAALQSARLANGFKRGFVNANLFISKIRQQPVCSFYSDDDSLDFACVSDDGVLQRLRCECGDLEIVHENGGVTIQPLQLEIDADERDLADFIQLHDPAAGVAVMARNKERSTLPHFVAGPELTAFLEIPTAPLGLGSFDRIEKKMPLKIASSDGPTADPR